MSEPGTLSWRDLLAQANDALAEPNEARWLCEEVSGWRGSEFALHLSTLATERAVAHFDALIARRQAGEPLQYVLGSWAFRTLDLLVDRRVLIPRPETEVVAGVALEKLANQPTSARVADLGTGSGAIALSLVAERPIGATDVWACDISHDALDVARANLAGLGRKGSAVRLHHGSWFAALPAELAGGLDLVVANPPYIAADDPAVADAVRAWEPDIALFADNDGFAAYDVIVAEAPLWLRPGGWLVLEIGYRQAAAVLQRCADAGLVDGEVRQDLAGLDRVVVARTHGSAEVLT